MPTIHDDHETGALRLRLSNRVNAAEEFTARDPQTLRVGVARALTRYVERHGPRWLGRAPELVLQVAPAHESRDAGWFAPCRVRNGLPRYVEVFVSDELLERRPPDDWTEIWDWCVASRAHDHALRTFARDVSNCLRPEDNTSD